MNISRMSNLSRACLRYYKPVELRSNVSDAILPQGTWLISGVQSSTSGGHSIPCCITPMTL